MASLASIGGWQRAQAFADPDQVVVQPVVTSMPDGGTNTVYQLPDGATMTTATPPPGFDPLSATQAELLEYNFPLPPTDEADLAEWEQAMAAYTSDRPPSGPITVSTDDPTPSLNPRLRDHPAKHRSRLGGSILGDEDQPPDPPLSAPYGRWAGFAAGDWGDQSHKYVAVKDQFTVPDVDNCGSSRDFVIWIGLGGTTPDSAGPDLLQQGLWCGNHDDIGPGNQFRPFTEFASGTHPPVVFCGYDHWTFAPGDVIYENMSFQVSQDKAYFYIEDDTTGVPHGCAISDPRLWHFNGSTAEWAAEAPHAMAPSFDAIHVKDARAELNSTSNFVTVGSQTHQKLIAGVSAVENCLYPGPIGSDNASFSINWNQQNC